MEATNNIPTYPDVVAQVEERFLAEGGDGSISEELLDALLDLYSTGGNGDFLSLIAFSRGCHALADLKRSQGDEVQAGFYYSMGQDLLAITADVLSRWTVFGNELFDVIRH